MSISLFRRQTIERIVADSGAICHYCKIECRLSFSSEFKNSATIDHKIPKSKGGTNDPANLLLACNGCNNAKGDRSYEDFIARPYPLRPERRKIMVVPRVRGPAKTPPKPKEHPAYKAAGGTLAAAIARGDMEPHGVYKKPKCEINPEPRNRINAVPYHETMYILTGKRVPKRADFFDQR